MLLVYLLQTWHSIQLGMSCGCNAFKSKIYVLGLESGVACQIGNIDFFMLLIFRKTSYINGKLFPPWLDIDLKERFAYPDYFRYELILS